MVDDIENDGFQQPRKPPNKRKIIYVGNLPNNLESEELQRLLQIKLRDTCSLDISLADCTIVPSSANQKSCHALISIADHPMDAIISKLNRSLFLGRKLVVQRERRKSSANPNPASHNKPLGFGGWTAPERRRQVEERVQNVVEEEFQQSNDPISTAIAAAAAVGVVTQGNNALLQQPLSDLLADYGEQDVNWKNLKVQENNSSNGEKQSESKGETSRLGQHGKVPIHVEFQSFGYHHGAPNEVQNGWSHAQPLPVHDCRDLQPVPGHLVWQDGLSGVVKRELLFRTDIRSVADQLAEQVADAMVKAIDTGGYGYAMPLKMTILVGSESGRHRSVVLCELAATALRKRLRTNKGDRFHQPCSVGTLHTDIQSRSTKTSSASSKSKHRDLFDE